MYSNILVPIAFEGDRAITPALTIARRLAADDATITLLHVMEQLPGYAISYLPAGYRDEAKAALKAELSALADSVPGASSALIEGHSGRSILDWADAHGVDLIVIASHRPGMQDILLGSTPPQVVHDAACADHVVR